MKPKISFLLIIGLFLALSNCKEIVADPAVHFLQLIQNKSNEHLLLVKSTENTLDSIIIAPDEEYVLLEFSSFGIIRGFQDCETEELGELSLKVEGSDSLMVKIDPNQSIHWQFTLFEENSLGGGDGECRLVIDEEDIE